MTGWRSPAFQRLGTRLDAIVGPKTAKAFEKLAVRTAGDLMHHLPRRYFAGTELSDLRALKAGEEVAIVAEVAEVRIVHSGGASDRSRPGARRNVRLVAQLTDRRGSVSLVFFGPLHLVEYWQDQLGRGVKGIFAGKVTEFNNRPQLTHPDFVMLDEAGSVVGGAKRNEAIVTAARAPLIGIYPATAQLRTWTIADSAALVVEHLAGLPDPLPAWIRKAEQLVDLESAFRGLHRPESSISVERGKERLRFDEAFALQLTMARRRRDAAVRGATPRPARSGGLLEAFDAQLPFELTAGQLEVSGEILAELARPHPMQRLLQGEVGSGKTVVALRAMLAVVDAGGQAALLAPTEVLAIQHLHSVRRLLGELVGGGLFGASLLGDGRPSTGVVLLTGSQSAAQRRAALAEIASGDAGIVIGTHALLGEAVQFADLGLVVVDEQHRFGVEQRAALTAKAAARPHLLVMTATPIPRSVAMTVFGDLAVSTLTEVPAGRAPVATVVVDVHRNGSWVDRAWQRIVEEVGAGRQAYVVCARISAVPAKGATAVRGSAEEPGRDDLAASEAGEDGGPPPEPAVAAEDLYVALTTGPLAGVRVGLLHGQLPTEEKEAVMARFVAGALDVLVATTVVEVGVDVPNASIMVIEDADRFGISQLHQLRGRIGRGAHAGTCLLLTSATEGSLARQRLDAVAATRDGFVLAEVDLEQRREGDVLGAAQAGGRSSLRLLRVLEDADLLARARELAERGLDADPELSDAGLADIVEQVERLSQGEWLERT